MRAPSQMPRVLHADWMVHTGQSGGGVGVGQYVLGSALAPNAPVISILQWIKSRDLKEDYDIYL